MLPHWDDVIQPFLAALGTGPIVEIGSAAGETTVKLAEFAVEHDLVLHAVDPAPEFDVDEFERRFDGHFRFYRQRSHDALEGMEPAAAVLIDGDHNWYTVHGELTRLEKTATLHQRHLPLVILHDVEWPYARRDMYYDPEAIPAEFRQPWARHGIRWEERLLDETGGGVNPHFANACAEYGPRNGVLTAVEDFVEESTKRLDLRLVHGEAGIGILVSRDLLASVPAIRREWERLRSTDFLLAQARDLAWAGARETAARLEAQRALRPQQAPAPKNSA